ncbi:MAG: hypothetical protein ACPG5B_02800 [Chitinophagales bacterium]
MKTNTQIANVLATERHLLNSAWHLDFSASLKKNIFAVTQII